MKKTSFDTEKLTLEHRISNFNDASSPLNYKQYPVSNNIIPDMGYTPFEDRTLMLLKTLSSSIDKEYTAAIGCNVYSFKTLMERNQLSAFSYESPFGFEYMGVYRFGSLHDYIGNIPDENQAEIKYKYEKLVSNPFLKFDFKLLILAPMNNFASDNNIKAIDPIVFAAFKDSHWRLIPLTYWI